MGSSAPKGTPKPENVMKLEAEVPEHPLHPLKPIVKTAKSICKIITPNKNGSGFFIKFFKRDQEFYCLMTNEHVVTKELVEQKKEIDIYYDSEDKNIIMQLNPKERFIKDFRDDTIDVTVIEILPKDNIPKDYFLLTLLDYRDNYDKLLNEDIAIIQYPKGEMNYSYGKIKSLKKSEETKYEFVHDASTDEGSSGSPIFLKGSTKVVGIHKGTIVYKDKKENIGDFIWPIFNYFKNFNESNNEIQKKKEKKRK